MDSGGKMDSCWFYTILLIFQTNYALRCCNTLFLQPRDRVDEGVMAHACLLAHLMNNGELLTFLAPPSHEYTRIHVILPNPWLGTAKNARN